MAQNYGPRITQDGLVMSLDPSQNKSYPAFDLPVKDGLVMWMDAADDTTFSYSSGTTVSQWRDKSGFNYHMTPVTAGPTRNAFLNSRKVIACTTSQQIWNSSINLSTSAYTIFCVTRLSGTTPSRVLSTQYSATAGGNWLLGHWGGHYNQYYAEGWVQYQGYPADNTWRMYMGDWSGSSTDLANLYSNGTAITTNSNGANAGPLGLGINISSEVSTCEAAEIIVFNKLLSTKERNLIHTYLGQKWGISNTDRQIFDLSGNNFNFAFNGTNPRYNAKTIVSNFDTTSPFAVSSFGGQNLTSKVLNLLYSDHTIEVAFNAEGFRSVYSYDNTLTTQDGQCIVLWTGRHSGLRVYQNTIIYEYWNSQSSTVGISVSISSYIDKIIYITATRIGDVLRLYINGVLLSGPSTVAATTSPVSYSQINIGAAYQGNPTTQGYIWAGQHEYHLLRMYNRQLTDTEVASNYQAFKARFDNNIVRFGLIMELDAGNPLSYAGSGSVWYDVSGNANHATLYNSPTWNSSGYFSLNGTNNYIKTTSTLNLSTYNAVTVLVIFKARSYPASGNVKFICELTTDFNSFQTGFVWTYNDNSASQNYEIIAGVKGDVGYNFGSWSKSNYNDLNWEITTAVFNKSIASPETSLYNQGVAATVVSNPVGGGTSNNTNNFGNDYLFIGSRAGTSNFTDLDIVSILVYNRALSAAEILQNYNAMKGRFGL